MSSDKPSWVDVNQDALDREWVEQVRLYYEHALVVADAEADLAEARNLLALRKSEVDDARAEADREVRTDPQSHGIEKLTEAAVESAVTTHRRVRRAMVEVDAAMKKVTEAGRRVGLAEVAIKALDVRKKALENLVQLRLANYFAEPRLPRKGPAREVVEEAEREEFSRRTRIRPAQ